MPARQMQLCLFVDCILGLTQPVPWALRVVYCGYQSLAAAVRAEAAEPASSIAMVPAAGLLPMRADQLGFDL